MIQKIYEKGATPLLLALLLGFVAYWGNKVDAKLELALTRIVSLETWRAGAVEAYQPRTLATSLWREHDMAHLGAANKRVEELKEILKLLGDIRESVARLETAAQVRGMFSGPYPKDGG